MKKYLIFQFITILAFATTIKVMDQGEMTDASRLVIQGRVLDALQTWNQTGSRIYSVFSVMLLSTINPEEMPSNLFPTYDCNNRQITCPSAQPGVCETICADVVSPGGSIGGVGLSVAGAPRFERGQELVFFLNSINPNSCPWESCNVFYRIAGFSQGLCRIDDGDGGLTCAFPPVAVSGTIKSLGGSKTSGIAVDAQSTKTTINALKENFSKLGKGASKQ